ncbi:MAG: type I restriction-modification system subunit M [Candidatus Limivicinus sp.]|jgi:type I restriction enzyme M protein
MNKQQLATKIWESANKMRSKIEANEYKDYILGFIFYKFLSEKEVKWLKANDFEDENIQALTEEDPETVEYVQNNIGYFIAYKDLYSTWLEMGKDFDVSNVTDAISAFNRLISPTHKAVFENIFQTLEVGLTKLGESSGARTKAISDLLQLIKDIPMDGKQDYDVLGFIYEYLIGQFAANAGKKAGEFYTPYEVSFLISEICAYFLRDRSEIKIYDSTSGSGSLLLNIGRSASKYMDKNNIKYYAQELKSNTYNLTRMNLVMRGIRPDNIVVRNGDTLEDDWPLFEDNDPVNTYTRVRVDCSVSNPPYSQHWDNLNLEHDPRFDRYGLAPSSKADYAFLLHDLYHVKNDGIMAIVLPHGVLFRGGEEGEIRKNLIENNNIDTIVGLPANIFYGTGIPTIVMFLRPVRENTDVLIVDASKCFIKEGKNNKLRASDIRRIVDAVIAREDIEKFCKVVSREEIRGNDYNLNIPRYVDSSEPAETWDIYSTMFGGVPKAELEQFNPCWKAFPALRESLFAENGTSSVELKTGNIKAAIMSHPDILAFRNNFESAFDGFDAQLYTELVDGLETVVVPREEDKLSSNIFNRLSNIPLIDKYEAYQLLDDVWAGISSDLEVIQSEGFESTKIVDPHMVLKKVKGKEEEVQDGWAGRILPFELVQQNMLQAELKSIQDKENRLNDITSEYEEIADSMTEEEKDAEYYADDSFVIKEVTKKLKELKNDRSPDAVELKKKLHKVEKLAAEEKQLKSAVKKEKAELEDLTKVTIENLSDEEVRKLLKIKWIDGLIDNLNKLPETLISEFIGKVEALAAKYADTFADVEHNIKQTENELCSMIGELDGNESDMKGLSELSAILMGD